jgi:hypothetical protein
VPALERKKKAQATEKRKKFCHLVMLVSEFIHRAEGTKHFSHSISFPPIAGSRKEKGKKEHRALPKQTEVVPMKQRLVRGKMKFVLQPSQG